MPPLSNLGRDSVAVLGSRDREEFKRATVDFCRKLGFDTISVTLVIDGPTGQSHFINVDNTPASYQAFFNDPANFPGCPVMRHCKLHHTPIVWNQSTFVAAGQGDRWEYQARHGYRVGIALALHLPNGRHLAIGVDRDQALPDDVEEVNRLVSSLALFGLCSNEAAQKILTSSSGSHAFPPLTPREREVLRWTLEGKTAWEVGMILAISSRTAAIHANNAARKLNCVNKHQAALRALQGGLI